VLLIWILGWLQLPGVGLAARAAFLDFSRDADTIEITTEQAAARIVETADARALRFEGTGKDGRAKVNLRPKGGAWDLSRFTFLVAEIRNVGSVTSNVLLFVASPSRPSKAPCYSVRRETVGPGEEILLRLGLRHKEGEDEEGNPIRVFGMRTTPYGKVARSKGSYADPARVTCIRFTIINNDRNAAFEVTRIHGLGRTRFQTRGTGFFPFIDSYGQFIHDEWEDKTHSDADLALQREREEKDLAAWRRLTDWNQWGGWKDGPTLKATGHFRVEKYQGKWWLVDPDGRLYFSHGVACVRCGDEMTGGTTTPVTAREHYFRGLPARDDPGFGRFFYVLRRPSMIPEYRRKGIKPICYNFSGANMLRKYGKDFENHALDLAHRRLAAWGCNSMGAWSGQGVCAKGKTPYAHTFGHFRSAGSQFGGTRAQGATFADVFSPEFAARVRTGIRAVSKGTADDPWCIGYFFGNEMPWPSIEEGIPRWTCESPNTQPAKRRMLDLLRQQYQDIAALNEAWESDYASWGDFLDRREVPGCRAASGDLRAFVAVFLDRYFRTIREALDAEAPHKLYLGCRFNTWSAAPAQAAARHCHVVSFNIYRWPGFVDRFELPGGGDVPILIGEWHFGTLDHGMFDHGITLALDQQQRAEQYVAYMRAVLAHPQFVGAHWFRYKNHPTTGRSSDGANAHNGLLDICDTPYRQTVEAARQVGRNLYRYRAHGRWDD